MTNADLSLRLARASRSSRAEAADYLDQTVLSILKRLKQDGTADWPGLGVFVADIHPSRRRPGSSKEESNEASKEESTEEKVACP